MRPREQYAALGPAGVGDVELVSLVLGTGSGGRPALSIAADLLHRYGGLTGLAMTEPDTLVREVPGVGLARAVRLHAALEAGRRSIRVRSLPDRIEDAQTAAQVLWPALASLQVEELHALYLDRGLRPLAVRCLTRGSDGLTVVDPRQVFRPAVALSASHVVLAHNHPSGNTSPSSMDREVTRRVVMAGQVLGVRLVDHLVVSAEDWCSMTELGLLPDSSGRWSGLGTTGLA